MTKLRKAVAATVMAVAVLAAAPVAFAMGGSSDSSPAASSKPDDPNYTAAVAAITAKDYAKAIPLLEQVVAKDPKNADAFNYLGYSKREMGQLDEALGYYQKALAINPKHRGAYEYLGELYLKKGDIKNAEVQLAKLDDLCTFGCDEYRELKSKIAAAKGNQGS